MLKIRSTSERDLPLICKHHYEGIKPSILNVLRGSNVRFSEGIKTEIERRIKDIVTSSPKELLIEEQNLYDFIFSLRKDKNLIDNELKKIFNYSAFIRRNIATKWNSYKLAKSLKIRTCVYCNRQYTFTVEEGNEKITRPQFDHFFSKEKHPLLALSFYNLIPCCSICNLRKTDKPFPLNEYLHPYEREYGNDGVFTWIPKNYRAMIGRSDEMDIRILERPHGLNRDSIVRQKNVFKLEKIYTEHSDFVQEIILKVHISKGQYFKGLQKLFGKGISKDELYRMALGNYKDETNLDKRTLSKLARDIAKELELII